jgi:hypothetical protein
MGSGGHELLPLEAAHGGKWSEQEVNLTTFSSRPKFPVQIEMDMRRGGKGDPASPWRERGSESEKKVGTACAWHDLGFGGGDELQLNGGRGGGKSGTGKGGVGAVSYFLPSR